MAPPAAPANPPLDDFYVIERDAEVEKKITSDLKSHYADIPDIFKHHALPSLEILYETAADPAQGLSMNLANSITDKCCKGVSDKASLDGLRNILLTAMVMLFDKSEYAKDYTWSSMRPLTSFYKNHFSEKKYAEILKNSKEMDFLLKFRNSLVLALVFVHPNSNKTRLIGIAAKLEGSQKEYKQGGGQAKEKTFRDIIFERESIHRYPDFVPRKLSRGDSIASTTSVATDNTTAPSGTSTPSLARARNVTVPGSVSSLSDSLLSPESTKSSGKKPSKKSISHAGISNCLEEEIEGEENFLSNEAATASSSVYMSQIQMGQANTFPMADSSKKRGRNDLPKHFFSQAPFGIEHLTANATSYLTHGMTNTTGSFQMTESFLDKRYPDTTVSSSSYLELPNPTHASLMPSFQNQTQVTSIQTQAGTNNFTFIVDPFSQHRQNATTSSSSAQPPQLQMSQAYTTTNTSGANKRAKLTQDSAINTSFDAFNSTTMYDENSVSISSAPPPQLLTNTDGTTPISSSTAANNPANKQTPVFFDYNVDNHFPYDLQSWSASSSFDRLFCEEILS